MACLALLLLRPVLQRLFALLQKLKELLRSGSIEGNLVARDSPWLPVEIVQAQEFARWAYLDAVGLLGGVGAQVGEQAHGIASPQADDALQIVIPDHQRAGAPGLLLQAAGPGGGDRWACAAAGQC
jgi:hypothetical protein